MEIDSSKWTGNGGAASYIRSLLGKKGPQDGHRETSTRVHGDTDAAATAGGIGAADAPQRDDTGAGAGESPSIVLGEIIAYRCWDTSNDLYQSLNGALWYVDEPMKGLGIALENSTGVYAFKTLAEARANAKGSHHRPLAVGSVKMWGTIVEHEGGYRAEYAMIDQIIDGAIPAYSDEIKKAIEAERSRALEHQEQHADDLDTYKFRCERYGDFLSVFIEREGKKIASALSLIGVGTITNVEGAPPKSGEISLAFMRRSSGLAFYRYEAAARGRMLFAPTPSTKEAQAIGHYVHFGHPQTFITIDRYLIEARDDEIHLTGTGVIIYAPHGRGPEVFEKILMAARQSEERAA